MLILNVNIDRKLLLVFFVTGVIFTFLFSNIVVSLDTGGGSLDTGGDDSNYCIPKTCDELGMQCGTVSDGCGAWVDCGSCDSDNCKICQNGQCVNKCSYGEQCYWGECIHCEHGTIISGGDCQCYEGWTGDACDQPSTSNTPLCKEAGKRCSSSSECCTGICGESETGSEKVCIACKEIGRRCSLDSDCCSGFCGESDTGSERVCKQQHSMSNTEHNNRSNIEYNFTITPSMKGWIGHCPKALGIFQCGCKNSQFCSGPNRFPFAFLLQAVCFTDVRKCAEGYQCYKKDGVPGCWPMKKNKTICESALETAKNTIISYDIDGDGRISENEYITALNIEVPSLSESDPCACKYKITSVLTKEEENALEDFYINNCSYSMTDFFSCQTVASNYGSSLNRFDINHDNFITKDEYNNAKTLWEKSRIVRKYSGAMPQPSGKTFCFYSKPGENVKVYEQTGNDVVFETTTNENGCAEITIPENNSYGIYKIKADGHDAVTQRICGSPSSSVAGENNENTSTIINGSDSCACTCNDYEEGYVPSDEEMAALTAAFTQSCNLVSGESGGGSSGGGGKRGGCHGGGKNNTGGNGRPSCFISADPGSLLGYGEVSIKSGYNNINGNPSFIFDCGSGTFLENQERNIILDGQVHTVKVLQITSPTTAKISVDGVFQDVEEKNIYDIGGLKIHVDDINEKNGARKSYVKMFFGPKKLTTETVSCGGESCETTCYFAHGGQYTISGSIGNVSCSKATVNVEPLGDPPIANFTYSPPKPKPGENITFDSNSSYDPDGERIHLYSWDFDDDGFFEENTTSTLITHSFSTPGYKNVTLKVIDAEGQENQITETVYVAIPVTLRIVSTQNEGNGQMITFTVDIPYHTANVTGMSFNFGDSSDTVFFDHNPGETYHLYTQEGNYTASVIVWFADGGQSTDEQEVIISQNLIAPQVSFSYSPQLPLAGQYIYFTVDAQDPDGGRIISYNWNYGDKKTFTTTSTNMLSYAYSTPGSYVVTLTATDDDGQTNSFSKLINVMPPQVSFEIKKITLENGGTNVLFSIAVPSSRNVNFMEMNFGDGSDPFYTDGYVEKIYHTYRNSGNYDVTLRVKFGNQILSTYKKNITVEIFSEGISMIVNDKGVYRPGEKITGNIDIKYYMPIPRNSTIFAYIDNSKLGETSMYSYLFDKNYYDYANTVFKYKITASGENRWIRHTEQSFTYTVKAHGTEGELGASWNADYSSNADVSSADGMKFIYDVSQSITIPQDANNDTVWEITNDNNSYVNLTMRGACGNDVYGSYTTNKNGWIERILTSSEFSGIPGTSDKEAYIERFDPSSLLNTWQFGERGGIYKNDVYQNYGTNVIWEGNRNGHGYVLIKNYDNNAVYKIRYLPPMGSKLCAYTSSIIQNSTPWEKSTTVTASIPHDSQYHKTYTSSELDSILNIPSCPTGSSSCEKIINKIIVNEPYTSSSNIVSIGNNYDYNTKTLDIYAIALSEKFSRNYTATIPLTKFNLTAPETLGQHRLSFKIFNESEPVSMEEKTFFVCNDKDGDGYCTEQGDCNDADPTVYPGAKEICDGKDNDCDGEIDEDFVGQIANLGDPCGIGACSGVLVCNSNGTGLVCSNKLKPGEQKEICDNNIDDDCDGITDEEYETSDGKLVPACVCKEGDKKPCGNDVGVCKKGYQICKNGKWSDCIGGKIPETEICNGLDDDCNGIVDDIFGSTDLSITHCACSGRTEEESANIKRTSTEICNNIDDNCNGKIDEGLSCCSDGATRPCINKRGACASGTQTCEGGSWGACSIQPKTEICGNNIDDDCDGKVDESDCIRIQNEGNSAWIVVAGTAAAVIIAVTAAAMMGKI